MKAENIIVKKKEKRKAKVDMNTYFNNKTGSYNRYSISYARMGELNKEFIEAVIKRRNTNNKLLFKKYSYYLDNLRNNIQDKKYSFEFSELELEFSDSEEDEVSRGSEEIDRRILYNSKIVQDNVYEDNWKRSKYINHEDLNIYDDRYINSFVGNNSDVGNYQNTHINECYKDIENVYSGGLKYQNTNFYDFNYESHYRSRSFHSLSSRCKCCDSFDDIIPNGYNYDTSYNQHPYYGRSFPCTLPRNNFDLGAEKNKEIPKKNMIKHTCPDFEIYKFLVKHYGIYCPYSSILDEDIGDFEKEKPFVWPFLEPPKKPRTVFDTGPTREEVGEYNRRIFDMLTAHINCTDEDIEYEYNPLFVDKDFEEGKVCVYKEYVELYAYNGNEYIINAKCVLQIILEDDVKNIMLKNNVGEILKLWNENNSKFVCKEDNLYVLCLEDFNMYCIIFRDHKHANKACNIIEK